MLLYLYGIIIEFTTNAPGHINNVFDGLNETDKHYLKGKMEFLGENGETIICVERSINLVLTTPENPFFRLRTLIEYCIFAPFQKC